jgi:hypothetical protein
MDNITCPDYTSACNASNAWVSGGKATLYERVVGTYSIFIKSRKDGQIIRTYSW